MAITAEEVQLLNRYGPWVAFKVQLGTLIQNAESVTAGEIALAEGKVLVGNASGVAAATTLTSGQLLVGSAADKATAVTVTGDVTISSTGVTAIAGGVIVNADVNASAAIDFSKLAALTSGQILVGSAGNVATAVAVSGDATLASTGAVTIANSAVTAGKISGSDGAVKVQRFSVGYAALNAATTGVAAVFGTALPDNAIVKKVIIDVTSTFVGNGDDGSTIKIGIEDQDNDAVAAIAISDVSNPWDAGFHAGIQDGAVANMVKLTAARQLAVTWTAAGTDTALTGGAMEVFVEYYEST